MSVLQKFEVKSRVTNLMWCPKLESRGKDDTIFGSLQLKLLDGNEKVKNDNIITKYDPIFPVI